MTLVLVLGLALQEFPAVAAGPDVREARRKFVEAVNRPNREIAAAEVALEDALGKAGALAGGDAQHREALAKMLRALRDFKAEKERILARDLGTYEKLVMAVDDYGRACQLLAAVVLVTVAVVVAVVASLAAAPVLLGAAVSVCAAIVVLTATLIVSLPELTQAVGEVLRALGFPGGADSADAAAQWMRKNMGSTFAGIQIITGAIVSIAAATTSLNQANAAAREAQAKAQAVPKRAAPALPTPPPALTRFDGYLGSGFAVHLDNGKATVGPSGAMLEGGVTISPRSDPSLKLTVNGRVVLKGREGAASPGPAGPAHDQENFRAAIVGPDGQVGTWLSLEGHGSVRITGFGPAAATIPGTALASQSNGIVLTGGEASFRGCAHTLAAGSAFTSSQVLLEGSLACGPWKMTASSLGIDKASVSGGGTFTAWARRFAMTYAAAGDALAGRGSLSGADTPWIRVPGFEAEIRIESPRLDLRLEGPSLSPTFGAGKVSVRTAAKKPDGNPWSSASFTPGTVIVPVPPSDGIPIPVPALPAPADVERGAREACEAGARRTLAGQALQRALDLCRSGHPSPPAVPALPGTISLKVGDVFR